MDSPTPSFPSSTTPTPSIRSMPTSPRTAAAAAASSTSNAAECDYDVNPTYLYQAVEAKQWHHATTFLQENSDAHKQCATWVIRKERDGKLRWRLLPLHAAVIFGAPLEVIELLLQEYPAAANQKDDQGMLPLHLCCRNFHSWSILEELLTAYPQGILIRDRKGRMPLECACSSFKKAASVMELYTHVSVTSETNKLQKQQKSLVEAKIQALQETHVSTLTRLKQDFQSSSTDLQVEQTRMRDEYRELQQAHVLLKQEFQRKELLEQELTTKLTQVTEALSQVSDIERDLSQEQDRLLKESRKENAELRTMISELLEQQEEMQETLRSEMENQQEEHARQVQELLLKQQQQDSESPLSTFQRQWQQSRDEMTSRLAELSIQPSQMENSGEEDASTTESATAVDSTDAQTLKAKTDASELESLPAGASSEPTQDDVMEQLEVSTEQALADGKDENKASKLPSDSPWVASPHPASTASFDQMEKDLSTDVE